MSTFSKRASYQLGRMVNFLKTFTRKRMGVLGIAIIALFAIVAVGAPYLAKYDPVQGMGLAGAKAAPAWLRYIPPYLGGNPQLSENFQIVTDSGFDNPPGTVNSTGFGEWLIATNNPGFNAEYASDVGYHKNGSIHISYMRDGSNPNGNCTFTLYKRFTYPYTGPPADFVGKAAVLVDGTGTNRTALRPLFNETSGSYVYNSTTNLIIYYNVTVKFFDVPVKVENFIGRADDINITWWPMTSLGKSRITDVYTGKWVTAEKGDSINPGAIALSEMFRLTYGKDAVSYLFPNNKLPADYFYGLKLTFLDNSNTTSSVKTDVYVDDFGCRLGGTSFGILGTDQHGRDLFSQLVYGSRISLYVGLLSASIGVVLGLIVGLLAGYLGRVADELLMRFTDMLLVIPTLPLLIVISAVLGTNLENLILIIGFLGWMSFARLVRSQVLSLKERPFIEAAKAAGAGKLHILTAHILPNVASLVYVSLATSVPSAIVSEAALAFLGFTDPWRVSWGKMLADAQEFQAWANWWWVIPPGLAIALISMSFIFLGYALDEVLNPKLRVRR